MYNGSMPTIRSEDLSPFGRLALQLDAAFTEMSRLNGQLQRLDIDSETGLERAVKILDQFAKAGQAVADGVQNFSTVLQEARAQSEAAAKAVMERAEVIGRRKREQRGLREELSRVEQAVAAVNAGLAAAGKNGKSESAGERNLRIRAELERVSGELKSFLADAQSVKEAAAGGKFKTIERDAQNLLDVLRASSRRVEKALAGS